MNKKLAIPEFTLRVADVRQQAKNTLYPHEAKIKCLADLLAAVTRDHVAGIFAGGKRSIETWSAAECLVLDVDNTAGEIVTPEDLAAQLPGVAFYVVFSRHHMQAKGSSPAAPRFHAFFPFNDMITGAELVRSLTEWALRRCPCFDPAAADLARFMFGVENPTGKAFPGETTLLELYQKEQQAAPAGREITEGQRNQHMAAFALSVLKRFGPDDIDGAESAYLAEAAYCTPPLPDRELEQIWHAAIAAAERKVWSRPGYVPANEYALQGFDQETVKLEVSDLSEVAEGEIFAASTENKLLFNPGTGWLFWDGCRYAADDLAARALAQQFTTAQLTAAREKAASTARAAGAAPNDGELAAKARSAAAFLKFVLRCRSSSGITHLLTEAQPRRRVDVEQLDGDPFLLNTPGGVVDLRTGEIKPCAPAYRCTKVTGCAPGSDGAELWREFLDTITCGDQALADYLQLVAGMAALGRVFHEGVICATGDGGNGKSTLFNILLRVFGDYGGTMSPDVLLTRQGNKNAELAELRGRRLVVAAETEEGARLDSSTVKRLGSTDKIHAEPKYKQPFDFVPSHTLVLTTNFLPRVGSSDAGTWSRLVVLPFNAKLRGSTGEVKNYAQVLFEKAGGAVLAWVVEGAQRFIAADYRLNPPAAVEAATAEYRNSCDWLGDFLADCCEIAPGYAVGARELYTAYREYCNQTGAFRRDNRDLKNALCSAGYEAKHTKKGKLIFGLRLRDEFAPIEGA